MVNHTLLLPNHLDAQPVLSLVRLIALLRNRYKDCLVENGIRIDSVLMYRPLPTWMAASTAAKLWLVPFVRLKRALKGVRGYNKLYSCNAKLAREYAAERHLGVCRTGKKLTEPLYARTLTYIKAKLKLRWSPEQISLRIDALLADRTLKDNDGWTGDMGLRPVSHMAIYRYIYGLNGNERKKAVSSLRRRGKPFKNTAKLPYNNTNRGKHSIHDRPASIDNLESYTDLEGDTVFGLDTKDRLLTHTERKSGLGSISLVIGYNATGITKQTKVDIERVFGKSNVATITYDNGVEFSSWRATEKTLDVDIYFADPYKSGQRGRNENFNGLIRDFYPKGTDFKKLTALMYIRPRKSIEQQAQKTSRRLNPA